MRKAVYPSIAVFATLFAINLLTFFTIGYKDIGDWVHILTLEGLLLDACGAVVVLTRDVRFLREFFLPTEKIATIENGRKRIFDEKSIDKRDDGFEEILEITDQRKPIDEDIHRIERQSYRSSAALQMSSVETVYLLQRKPEVPEDAYAGRSPTPTDKQEKMNDWYDTQGRIDGPAILDSWISQELQRLEQSTSQLPLSMGIYFLLFGFLLQGFAQSLQIALISGQ